MAWGRKATTTGPTAARRRRRGKPRSPGRPARGRPAASRAGHPGPVASTIQEVNGTGLGADAEACAVRGTRDQTQNTTPEVKFQGLLRLGRGPPLPSGPAATGAGLAEPSVGPRPRLSCVRGGLCPLSSPAPRQLLVFWGILGQALLPVHLDQLVQLHGGLGVLHRRVSALPNLIAWEGRAQGYKTVVPSSPAPRPHVLLLRVSGPHASSDSEGQLLGSPCAVCHDPFCGGCVCHALPHSIGAGHTVTAISEPLNSMTRVHPFLERQTGEIHTRPLYPLCGLQTPHSDLLPPLGVPHPPEALFLGRVWNLGTLGGGVWGLLSLCTGRQTGRPCSRLGLCDQRDWAQSLDVRQGQHPGPGRAWQPRGPPPGMGATTWMSRFSSFLVRRFRDTVAFSGQSAFRLRRGMWEVSRVSALGWQY